MYENFIIFQLLVNSGLFGLMFTCHGFSSEKLEIILQLCFLVMKPSYLLWLWDLVLVEWNLSFENYFVIRPVFIW